MRWSVAVLLVSGVAHAERRPFGAVVTAGIGTAGRDNSTDDDYHPITAMQLDVGLPFRDLMLGAHVGFASGTPQSVWHYMSMSDVGWLYTYRPMQLGLTGHVALHDRFYVTPWLGVQGGWLRQECETFVDHDPPMAPVTTCTRGDWALRDINVALGVGVGVDAIEVNGHRLTVTAAASHAFKWGSENGPYTSVWLGIGYRFWDR